MSYWSLEQVASVHCGRSVHQFIQEQTEQALEQVGYGHLKGKSSELVQCTMLKACDACADMGQL